MHDVTLGPFAISDDSKPVFVAEIGALFNQDMDLAFGLIDSVAKARDAVPSVPLMLKGEVLWNPDICLDDNTEETYQSKEGERRSERYRDLIERRTLPLDNYAKILSRCRGFGLSTIMSVYDYEGADFAVAEGVAALKIASSNVTHRPLIRHVARHGNPVLIDTGRATLGEVEAAVRLARQEGSDEVLVQHSPDGHPAPPENHNLLSLQTLRSALDVHVGLSCHSSGTDMLIMAIALGANFLEKNVVFDDTLVDQDYAIAANIADLPEILRRVDNAWTALGRPFRDPTNESGLIHTPSRFCLVARRDLGVGDVISEETIHFAFPCKGIPVEHFDEVTNWRIRAPVTAGKPVGWADVEP